MIRCRPHLVSGGIAAETRQALENVRNVLEQNGFSLDRVVKRTAMLAAQRLIAPEGTRA